jgi:Uma2 family endonuclease
MNVMPTVVAELLTAAEYAQLPDDGQPTELVRGRVVPVNVPAPRHGEICVKIVRILGRFLDDNDIGRLVGNDSGVVTEHDPDTVRGGDVAFYSYGKVPKGPLSRGYLDVVPELVFEVRSPTDRWSRILTKVGEYLEAGVTLVCVLDEATLTARVYRADHPEQVFTADQELTLPEVLPGFQVSVGRFFE